MKKNLMFETAGRLESLCTAFLFLSFFLLKTNSLHSQNQALVTNIVATTGNSYTLGQLNLGTTVYTDRTYQVTTVPAFLNNAPFIKTPNNDKANKGTSVLSFDLSQNAVVYIAYDPRAETLPDWLSSWQKLPEQVGLNDSKISFLLLYSKAYPAGSVTLGGNLASPAVGAQNTYIVIVQPIQYSLAVTTSGNGTVAKSPDQQHYAGGTRVNLTAIPSAGEQFTGWSGDASGADNPLSITMDADKSVTATFAPVPIQYSLAVTTSGNGTVSKSPDQQTYTGGTNVSLTAIPSAGEQFTGWSGDASGTDNPLSITMDGEKNVTAAFAAQLTADSLFFSSTSLSYSVGQNGTTSNQSSTLTASSGISNITLAKSANSSWLVLPSAALGSLSFGINSEALIPGTYNTTVTASATGYADATLNISLTVSSAVPDKSISFTQASQTAEVEQGSSQSLLDYISTTDNVPVNAQLTAVDGSNNTPTWLSVNGGILNGMNYTTGSEITFDFDATNLSVGTYPAVITASAAGYNNAVLNILLTVKSPSGGSLTNLKVNFQDSLTTPPAGWLGDFGQAFGPRTSANQGSGNSYGWLKRSDSTPVDLTKNGRKRTTLSDVLLATFMHIQGNDIVSSAITPVEGIWQAEVTNGNYDVTVSVGDNDFINSTHSINVEGVNAIAGFVPTSATKFKSATVTVSVADGFLTIDAMGGTNTKINYINIQPSASIRPSVIAVNPENSSQNVSENTSISTSILKLPNGGINNATITTSTVYLTEEATGVLVPSNVNGTGGGDAITLVPSAPLKLGTTYNFNITSGVQDLSGASFIPYASRFTTASGSTGEILTAKFDKIDLPNATGRHSSLTKGPDGKLYALSIDGIIKRFSINSDGTLATPDTLYSLQDAYGPRQPRLAIGLAFDPSSTAGNLVVWVTHSSFVFLGGPDWDGKLSRLSGNNLQTVQDVLVNLPRSAKDHVTNSIAFGPDGALYFTQGSTSAMGRADQTWSNRSEHLLSAAVLRLDVSKLGALPLNVKTAEGGGTYNPYAANAPLTIYASGVRNAYDLVWHSNGNLYVATNGSAAGGNTPASVNGTLRTDGFTYNGPVVPALTNVQQTQKDFLFRVVQGGYYGHPNPLRGEYVMNGGNPTSSIDPGQVDAYPVGTMPDVNWRGYSFDFQNNKSPDGSIEYKSNTFNGALKGKLLVVRYSQHDDIITLAPGGVNNDIVSSTEGNSIEGFSGFIDPLNLTEDVNTGNIYVSEYGGNGKIVLLRPKSSIIAPTVVTVGPIADAFVRSGTYATINYGSDTALLAKTSPINGYTRNSYLKFSLNNISKVTSAKLRLYGHNTENTASINLSVFGVNNDSWTESGVTFNNAPGASTPALSSVGVNDQAGYYELDVTSYVAAQFNGDKMVTLLVKDTTSAYKTLSFKSKENGLNAPQLVIVSDSGQTSPPPNPGVIAATPAKIYDNDVSGGAAGVNRTITVNNTGSGVLSVSAINITGTNSAEFNLSGLPTLPANINAGSSISFSVAFNPSSVGLKTASININSDDTSHSVVSIPLRGLGTSGLGGANEPSLQSILTLLEIPVTVGDDNTSTAVINSNTTLQKAPLLGEEVSIQKFQKADTGNVTITPLAVFGPTDSSTVLGMGWYKSGKVSSKSELFTVSDNPLSNGQTVNVNFTGSLSFNPAADTFGFYSRWPFFANRHLYSEDNLNTFSGSIPHHVRVYPYKNNSGVVANAYIVAFEEHISGFDYQDIVFVIKNVKPATVDLSKVIIDPLADAYVRNGSFVDNNYGTDTTLKLKSSSQIGFTRYSYLKFQLSNISNVKSAKLRLYGGNTENTTSVNITSFGVDDDSWTENGITFNNAPSSLLSPLSSVGVNNQEKYYEFDVTTYVKDEFDGDKVVSFLVKDPANKNVNLSFNSKENGNNIPQLVVDTTTTALSNALLFVENLDKFPANDEFVFSRIQIPWTRDSIYNANHDSLKVRIHNKGINPLIISNLALSDTSKWKILKLNSTTYVPGAGLPVNVNSGSFLDVTLKFIALDQATRVKVLHETLVITSNDDKYPLKTVFLTGLWQKSGEGSHEPYAQEIIDAFGFKTKVGFGHTDPDLGDSTKLKGDEIKPSYFLRADPSLPVSVRQLSAYHGCCHSSEKLQWYAKGSATYTVVYTHTAVDGQTVLPRKSLPATGASGTFNPTTAFGFRIGSNDYTDAAKTPGKKIGIRVWKAFDSKGNIIPNAYIISNDYLGTTATNYDYNDNTHFVTNVKPATGSVNFSTLGVTPSALDFGEKVLQTTDSLVLNIKSNGQTYADGSSDPAITISAVEIAGENKSEFSAAMPLNSTLNPQQASTIKVKFKPVSQGLKIADLLIHYNNSLSPQRVPLYGIAKSPGTTVTANFRINSGATTALILNGKAWSADNQYSFDNLEPFTNSTLSNKIVGTDEDPLYTTEQSSNADKKPFRYEIPIANGNYVVRLHFAEIYWGNVGAGLSGGTGSRVMSVKLENQLRLINFDVLQEAGTATVIIKNLPVTVSDGKLNIDFSATVNRPMVNAVEVYSFSSSGSALMAKSTSSSSTNTETSFSMEQTDGSENNFERPKVYPNPLHNKFNIEFPSKYQGNFTAQIIDMLGRKYEIAKTKLKAGGSNMQIDITKLNLKAGVYFLKIHSETGKTELYKLIIK